MAKAIDKCFLFLKALKGKKKFEWEEKCEAAFHDLKEYMGSLNYFQS